jgi:hypothetical protein
LHYIAVPHLGLNFILSVTSKEKIQAKKQKLQNALELHAHNSGYYVLLLRRDLLEPKSQKFYALSYYFFPGGRGYKVRWVLTNCWHP